MAEGNIYEKPIYHVFAPEHLEVDMGDCYADIEHLTCDTMQAVEGNLVCREIWGQDAIVIYGVQVKLDNQKINNEIYARREQKHLREQQDREASERVLYERLKAKFSDDQD